MTRAIGSPMTETVIDDADSVSADGGSVSADAGTVSADAGSVSADAGHHSDLKPKRSSLSHARGQGEYRPVARATGAKKKPRRNVGAQVLPKLIGRA